MTRSSRLPSARSARGRHRALSAAALAALGSFLSGCDSPACVFGGDCSKDPSSSLGGANPAFRPADHAWVSEGAPAVELARPSGSGVHTDTPIAVVFDESMAAQTVVGNVGLFQGGTSQPVPISPAALVGDGRVLVVIPLDLGTGALKADTTYELRWDEDALVTDLTGSKLVLPADRVITSFTTAATNPTTPKVVLTFPQDADANQSATGELVVVFDRRVQQSTVNAQSFVVTADGQAPSFNPPPQPVLLIGQGAFPTTDTRVWQYRSVDGAGEAVSLGESAAVRLRLSPQGAGGARILAVGGAVLPETTIDFLTAGFAAPAQAALASVPDDAVGIDNLAAGGGSPLDLRVTLPNAQGSDLIGIFLFGRSKAVAQDQALFREVRVADVPYDPLSGIATLTEAELDLASSAAPVVAHFAEGELTIALRTERGGVQSPVRLVDVDPERAGPQDVLLDVTRPTFDAFGSTGNEHQLFVSDQRDLAVVGRASEELRAVFVDAGAAGDNGAPFGGSAAPPVVGSSAAGLFVAAPVPVGALDPAQQPLAFSMRLFDRALNGSANPISATFVQRGAGFGAAGGAGSALDLQVFDRRTLSPIQGASVFLHADTGGGIVFTSVSVTDAGGLPQPPLLFPAGEALVTVSAANYDLFSYHGLPSGVLGIPLNRTTNLSGSVLGTVSSTSAEFPNFDRYLGDSATFPADEAAGVVSGCSFNVATLSNDCAFGPLSLRPGPVRGASLVAVDVPATAFNFTAQGFLRAFALELPLAGVAPGAQDIFDLRVDQLLSDSETPQEERAVDGPSAALDASALVGVDLTDLDGDPRVAVQALARGLGGSVLTGFGAALDPLGSPPDTWVLRSALPGVADPTSGKYAGDLQGLLVTERTIENDLFLRVELRDQAGNRAGRRPRFSALGASVVPLEVARVSAPLSGGNTGGEGFDVTFDNVLAGFSATGLYRVTLIGPNGRAWELYRRAAAGASRTVHVPDLVAVGGPGLPNGPIDCRVEAFEWGTFDPTDFLFSDLEREYDRFSEAAPITFDKP